LLPGATMNGAEACLRTLINAGVSVCFTNPGTTEMGFVAAFEQLEGMRPVLTLFEGVAAGAADGYARMVGQPAATLLHLGPGFANGLANFHNARRAQVPMINLVGDHATYHRQLDAPLNSEIELLACHVSGWVRSSMSAAELPVDTAEAVAAACAPPGQLATLIIPAEATWHAAAPAAAPAPPAPEPPSQEAVDAAGRALKSGRAALLLAGDALLTANLNVAGAIGQQTGARLYCETFARRLERGAGRVPVARLPYFPEAVTGELADLEHLILVGARRPVSFFAYPNQASDLVPPACQVWELASEAHDLGAALAWLADAVAADPTCVAATAPTPPGAPRGALTPEKLAAAVSLVLPEGAIVSDEANTGGLAGFPLTAAAAPHDWLFLTGGSIGQGLPVATGAAVACPDRKVLALQADGGGAYTVQALWTQARENLDVTTVIYANRQYRILGVEYQRLTDRSPGPRAMDLIDIDRPTLDWVALASGFGVPAVRSDSAEDFQRQLANALAEPGPRLIEAVL
jgi:acetolactate synthase-1/2/3 large subunit